MLFVVFSLDRSALLCCIVSDGASNCCFLPTQINQTDGGVWRSGDGVGRAFHFFCPANASSLPEVKNETRQALDVSK